MAARRSLSVLPRLPSLFRDVTRVSQVCPTRSFTAAQPFPVAQYGGRFTVTMIPGDGIGPEMMGYVRNIFRYAGVPVDFEEIQITKDSTEEEFEKALVCIKRNGVALKGSIESVYGDPSFSSRNATLRRQLDLFANVLHCRSHPTVPARYPDLDLVLIRENTEGEYSMLEHEFAVFEPGTRNTGSSVAGMNVANPVAMLNAACDMLHHLGLTGHANLISKAIDKTINVDMIHTADIGGQATSLDVVQNVIQEVQEATKEGNW